MGGIAAAIIVLCGTTFLLQWHSIHFWVAQVGPSGIGFSLLLDAMGLWLWYQRTFTTRSLGVLTSVLLLAGPIYWVATPVIDKSARASHDNAAREANIAALETEISQREEALGKMSTGAGGGEWAAVIQQTQAELARVSAEIDRLKAAEEAVPEDLQRSFRTLRNDLRNYQSATRRGAQSLDVIAQAQTELAARRAHLVELRAFTPTVQAEERAVMIVGMQVFALILFQLGAILAINRIAQLRTAVRRQALPTVAVSADRVAPISLPLPVVEEMAAERSEGEALADSILSPSEAPATALKVDRRVLLSRLRTKAELAAITSSDNASVDTSLILRRARRALEDQLKSGYSAERVAASLGVTPRDLSLFLRHEELLAAGERTLNKTAMSKILTQCADALLQHRESAD